MVQRLVCAWCGEILREGVEPISHGICPTCEQEVERATEQHTQDTIRRVLRLTKENKR
jgi:hypothetical protein